MYKALVDPLKEEVEALKEKIRQMDTDISYYKTKLEEPKDNVVQNLASMYLSKHFYCFKINRYSHFIFVDNSQEQSSNSLATGDFVFLNSSIGNYFYTFYG